MTRESDPGLRASALVEGRFRLRRRIGRGAMGEVWDAIDELGTDRIAPGTPVALKLLHAELHADPSLRRRFRREASILASLSHPAIVRVLDAGTEGAERSYMAMELLAGETLEALLARRGTLTPSALAPIVRATAEGLFAIHQHGVIHGDIKPSNIFLCGAAPGVRIVDFGLSKVEGLERLTRTGELTGTPVYMAPELLTGARDLDARIDQYALGVVLYESLAGALPFVTKKHPGAVLFDIVKGKVVPLHEVAPTVPPAVRAIVERAMAPSREARFEDVLALARALEEATGS